MNRFQLNALVLLIGIISVGVSYFRSGVIESAILFNFGTITSILAVVLIVFNTLVWKWRFLYPWFVSVPNLNGTWTVKGRFRGSGPSVAVAHDNDEGEAIIEQTLSNIYLMINWKDTTEMQFVEAAPLAVSGVRTRRCALSAIWRVNGPCGSLTRSAFMSFDVPGKLFANRPSQFTVFYSTTDDRHGELTFSGK